MSAHNDETISFGSTDYFLGWVTLKEGNRYFWLNSANRYKGTGCGNPTPNHILIPSTRLEQWMCIDLIKSKKVWISEAPLKTDIASDYMERAFEQKEIAAYGDAFIELPRVNAWRSVLPAIEDMGVEEINLCFDVDW